ncbi:hypothetical protein [Haloplanus sp. C73]
MVDGNLALVFVAFLVAFNVPLGLYWLYKRRTGDETETDEST